MPVGDGSAWDETNPTNSTLAISIDDYDRDMRIGVRSRMALEHEWPSSQSATNQAGQHKFVTLQQQASKPTLSGTQLGAVYMKTVGSGLQELFWENEAGTEVQLTSRGVGGNLIAMTGTVIRSVVTVTATNIPIDGSEPQLAEGDQVMTFTHTPQSATNLGKISFIAPFFMSGDNGLRSVMALFNNASTALSTGLMGVGADEYGQIPLEWFGTFGTTGAITFQIRGAKNATGSLIVNGRSGGGSALGNANGMVFTVQEFRV